MAQLSLVDVTAAYAVGRTQLVRALHRASLQLRSGEVVGLIGESGSGKSTIGRVIAGLEARNCRLEAGTLTLDGERLFGDGGPDRRPELRGRRVGYIFQNAQASFDPLVTVKRQFLEVLRHRFGEELTDPLAVMRSALADVGLPDVERVLRSRPHQLSGGMAQRAAIAFALASRPQFLIADEATSALDVDSRKTVVDVMRHAVSSQGLGVLFITHDIALAESICDRIVVMYGGETVEVFVPPDQPMRHRYSVALRAATPAWVPKQTLVPIPGMQQRRAMDDVGCPFLSRCDEPTPGCASDIATSGEGATSGDGAAAGAWVRCLNPVGDGRRG